MQSVANIDLSGIGWVAVGGMSGPLHKKHQMDPFWAAKAFGGSITLPIDDVLMQVIVIPTHRDLQNAMELLERRLAGELNAPPY